MKTILILLFLFMRPLHSADVFNNVEIKVGKSKCVCSFKFTLTEHDPIEVDTVATSASCDKKCSGSANNAKLGGPVSVENFFTFGMRVKRGKVQLINPLVTPKVVAPLEGSGIAETSLSCPNGFSRVCPMTHDVCPNGSRSVCPKGFSPSMKKLPGSGVSRDDDGCICVPFFLMEMWDSKGLPNRKLYSQEIVQPSACEDFTESIPKTKIKLSNKKSCTCSFKISSNCGLLSAAGVCDRRCSGRLTNLELQTASGNRFSLTMMISKGKAIITNIEKIMMETTSLVPETTSPEGNGCLCITNKEPGSGVQSVLTIEENGETFQQKISLTEKLTGNIMQVDVPDHGNFVGMSVMIAADTSGNWHTKNNMVFKMENFSRIMDLPIEFNPEDVVKVTQDFVNANQILDKKDEEIFYTILVDQGSLSEQEIQNLNPELKALVESTSVSRVAPQNITKEQFQNLLEGGRIVTKSNGGKTVTRSGTDSGTCSSHTSMVFDHPTSHCWQWINPVTGTQIGVHQIIVTTAPNTPDPASISCCHDPTTTVQGTLAPEIADCCDRYHPSLCLCTASILNSYINMSPADFASECWKCANVKTRKSVASMTFSEVTETVDALNHITSTNLYVDIANYHGAPWMCNAAQTGPASGNCLLPFAYCPCCKPHKLNDRVLFLPWHRLFTAQMEWAMQEHESSFTIPYWDWTASNTIPSFWLSGPIKSPMTSACSSTTTTQRSVGSINSNALGNLVRRAFSKRNLLDFSGQIESPHNNIHVTIGCDMGTVDTASYDPIFYLHHTYIDYQFAYWQELQAIYGYPEFNPSTADMDLNLEPFNRNANLNTRTLRNCKGKNTFDYKNTLCYEYDELLFRGQTPNQFTTTTTSSPGRRKRSLENRNQNINGLTPLQFVMDEMERNAKPRVFIGVSMRAIGVTSEQTVTVCRKEQCVEAVKLSTFGANAEPVYEDQISSPYLVEYELTELFEHLIWPTHINPDVRSYITRYTDQGGNELPLEKTFLPVFVWRFPDQKESKGSEVLQVHFTSKGTYADKIFADPPYQVDIYGDSDFIERISVSYQHQTYQYTGPVNEAKPLAFGHNEYYQCKRGKALSKLPGQVTILQPSDFGWTLDGDFLFSGQIDHTQGKLLLVVWCSGYSNMNEFETKEDFARCQVNDTVPREGPISYAVNTTAPGMLYLGSGVDTQCRTGRKIAINVKKQQIGRSKPLIDTEKPGGFLPEGVLPEGVLPEGVRSGDFLPGGGHPGAEGLNLTGMKEPELEQSGT